MLFEVDGDCEPCEPPISPGVAGKAMGRLLSLNRPRDCRIASSLRRSFSFWRAVFLAGLLSSVTQTFGLPSVRSSATFLQAQGSYSLPPAWPAEALRHPEAAQPCSAKPLSKLPLPVACAGLLKTEWDEC